jgi:pimeloyl-ACP methyl ester carboxylesterase
VKTDTATEASRRSESNRDSDAKGRIRRIVRWVRNILLLIPPLLFLTVLAGQAQQARLARAYPPLGEMVTVGEHRLHVMTAGDGPTVVFENGPGGMGLDWSLVASEVAQSAMAVSYDRAGLGWSEPAGGTRDILTLVEELRLMLDSIQAPPPYVLVGHSYGGLIVRAFAFTYPEKVAGLVLVDAAHEDQLDYYPEEYAAKARSMGQMMARLRGVYRIAVGSGIPALFSSAESAPGAGYLPGEVVAARHAATVMDSSHATASTDEMASLLASLEQVRDLRKPLGDVPVRVVSHGRPPGREAGVPPGLEAEVEAAWLQMQHDLLMISNNSGLVIAEGSGHDIHLERPDVVIDAIAEIIAEAFGE